MEINFLCKLDTKQIIRRLNERNGTEATGKSVHGTYLSNLVHICWLINDNCIVMHVHTLHIFTVLHNAWPTVDTEG